MGGELDRAVSPATLAYEDVPQQVESEAVGDVTRVTVPATAASRHAVWWGTVERGWGLLGFAVVQPITTSACRVWFGQAAHWPSLLWIAAMMTFSVLLTAALLCGIASVLSRRLRPTFCQVDGGTLTVKRIGRSGEWDCARSRIRGVTVAPWGRAGQLRVTLGHDTASVSLATMPNALAAAAALRAALGLQAGDEVAAGRR